MMGVVEGKLLDPAQGDEQVVLVHIDGLVGLAHDLQVDGVEGQLGQDAGKDGRDAHEGVEQAGDEAGGKARQHSHEERHPDVLPRQQAHDAHCTAGAKGAVHGQVGHIKDAVGEINADGHDAPDQALCARTRQSAGQVRQSCKQFQNDSSCKLHFFIFPLDTGKRRKAGKCPSPLYLWFNLSVSLRSTAPLPRGASGEEMKFSVMPRPPLDRGGGTPQA